MTSLSEGTVILITDVVLEGKGQDLKHKIKRVQLQCTEELKKIAAWVRRELLLGWRLS